MLFQRIAAVLVSVPLFALSFSVSAQSMRTSSPIGFMSEVTMGYMTCSAVKQNGASPVFVISTNRPDMLFEDMAKAERCISQAAKQIKNIRKYKHTVIPLYQEVNQGLFFYGEFGFISCREMRSKAGFPLQQDYVFPWLKPEEIKKYINKDVLVECLGNLQKVTPVAPPTITYNSLDDDM